MNSAPIFDQMDYQIIRLMNRDAGLPASEIARQIGANERTVRKRIERLVAHGAIRLVAVVDPHVFGYVTSADIFLEVEPEQEDEVLQQLFAMPEISYLAYGTGTHEYSIEARFKSNAELHQFLRKTLPGIPGLTVTRYALVPEILRNIDEWLPREEDFS